MAVTDAVLLFLVSVALAAALLTVAYAASTALRDASLDVAEYVALRNVAPYLMLDADNETVHLCVNTTAPVYYVRNGAVVRADNATMWRDRRGRWHTSWGPPDAERVFCSRYLGPYRVGDSVAYLVVGGRVSLWRNYTVAAVPLSG
ncbi:MAG: hypothetical protein QXP31_03520 [Pyrobaculum sp.]